MTNHIHLMAVTRSENGLEKVFRPLRTIRWGASIACNIRPAIRAGCL